jgi:hypothetical protein
MSLRVLVSAALFAIASGFLGTPASAAISGPLPAFEGSSFTQAGEFQAVRKPPRKPRKPRRPPRPPVP